jgi:hypothetical protein
MKDFRTTSKQRKITDFIKPLSPIPACVDPEQSKFLPVWSVMTNVVLTFR